MGEYGGCGHFGNDYNSKMCGGIGGNKANCPKSWTPSRGQPFLKFSGAEKKYPGISAEMKCKKAKMKWFLKSDSYSIPDNVYTMENGKRELNYKGAITLPNCDPKCFYLWHAQYECVDPPMDEMVKAAKKQQRKQGKRQQLLLQPRKRQLQPRKRQRRFQNQGKKKNQDQRKNRSSLHIVWLNRLCMRMIMM